MTTPTQQAIVATPPAISSRVDKALRHAMHRLLAGKPERTDGRLIKDNLWKEAGVSRATMNRAREILAEWDAHLAATRARTAGEARRDDQLTDLRHRIAQVTEQRDRLTEQLNAAATVIAALHADNIVLREQLHGRNTVVSIDLRRMAN